MTSNEPQNTSTAVESQEDRNIKRYWVLSIAFSLVCIALMMLLIVRSIIAAPPTREAHHIIASESDLNQYKQEYERSATALGWGKPIYIPTGIFVQSIEFTGPYNVRATGYVWQRYGKDVPAEITRGVIFPEAEKQDLTEAYRVQQGDEELIGWYFVLNLRQQFDYSRFPFDQQDIWFRLWHPDDFHTDVDMIPDLEGYETLNPKDTPGIEKSLVLEGWDVVETFFSYMPVKYNTNLGYRGVGTPSWSDLYFNVGVQREIPTPLLTQAVSPIVVLMLVFVTFLFFTRDHERRGAFGLSWSGVIGVWSGLFFATLVAQSGLRNMVKSESFVYLESLHILLYPLILVVATVSTIVVVYPGFKILKYHDNVVPKLLYWPIVTGVLLIATLILFL